MAQRIEKVSPLYERCVEQQDAPGNWEPERERRYMLFAITASLI
jgi:hypothetical protein